MTHETFLIPRLGLSKGILNELVKRGEAIRDDTDHGSYYGLPHSSLADAFWKHGKDFLQPRLLKHDMTLRAGRESEDFVYEYAVSGTPNALTAIVLAEDEVRKALLVRIHQDATMPGLIRTERSIYAIAAWTRYLGQGQQLDPPTQEALATRIASSDEGLAIAEVISHVHRVDHEAAQVLLASRSPAELSRLLSEASEPEEVLSAALALTVMTIQFRSLAENVVAQLKPATVASRLSRPQNVEWLNCYLLGVYQVNWDVGKSICSRLKRGALLRNLRQAKDKAEAGFTIALVGLADEDAAEELVSDVGDIEVDFHMRRYLIELRGWGEVSTRPTGP